MKKYIKYLSVILLAIVLCSALASCAKNYYYYQEWYISEDENVLTNGTEEYYLYDEAVYKNWRPEYRQILFYGNSVKMPNGGKYYNLLTSKIDNNIVLLYKNNDFENDFIVYATEHGRKILNTIMKEQYDKVILVNESRNLQTDAYLDQIEHICSIGNQIKEFSTDELSIDNRIVMYATDINNFMVTPYAAIYNISGEQFYVQLTDYRLYVDKYGYFTDDSITVEAIQLNEKQRHYITDITNNMYYIEETPEYEVPMYDEEEATADKERAEKRSMAILLVVIALFSILCPACLVIVPIKNAIKKKFNIKVVDYILLCSLALWLISGIVLFIVFLC